VGKPQTQTDNRFLSAKLLLRRHFLTKYPPVHVLDCCQGAGTLWKTLKPEYPTIATYWGLDKKPKKGRLMFDSARILESGQWHADVIDVDTYGSPWTHWFHLLKYGQGPMTIFLTVGLIRVAGGGIMAKGLMRALKLQHFTLPIPPSLLAKLHDTLVGLCLREAVARGWTVLEAHEAFPSEKARYLGIRLTKQA